MLRVPTNWSTLDNKGDDQQAEAQEQDEEVGHDGGHEKVPSPDRDPVKEDHRHGVLQHRERERAEEEHGYEEDTAHHLAVGQKGPQFLDQRIRLTRHDKLEILPQGAGGVGPRRRRARGP